MKRIEDIDFKEVIHHLRTFLDANNYTESLLTMEIGRYAGLHISEAYTCFDIMVEMGFIEKIDDYNVGYRINRENHG